jgi:hypothetical protein
MFIGPVYRASSSEVRAQVDWLLGIEPGHRDSNQIVVGYCQAAPEVRAQIDELLGLENTDEGGRRVKPGD